MFSFNFEKKIDIQLQKKKIIFTNNKTQASLVKYLPFFHLLHVKNDKLYILNNFNLNINDIYRLKNLIYGLKNNFLVKLNLVGLGFKITKEEENKLVFSLGFSHTIKYNLPSNISLYSLKNRNTIYLLTGPEYSKLKQEAANIIKLKKPEPYKGKGIRYYNQIIKLKEGKKSN